MKHESRACIEPTRPQSPGGKRPAQFNPGVQVPMQCEPTEGYPVRRRYYQAGGTMPGKIAHWK